MALKLEVAANGNSSLSNPSGTIEELRLGISGRQVHKTKSPEMEIVRMKLLPTEVEERHMSRT
jgi:hypothetical protein